VLFVGTDFSNHSIGYVCLHPACKRTCLYEYFMLMYACNVYAASMSVRVYIDVDIPLHTLSYTYLSSLNEEEET